ncbi:hypothetical protein BpHYR1_004761 [Brachionus plicatilis]|uniref:Uncharacterized protein n=1 Tax=Brachionus plicatilis TaxID=10195 RepID=A0A3M7RRZ3_BRAPC|nr:hypothetical protein BpHYR1_004761 [Brachionus plicatilis]
MISTDMFKKKAEDRLLFVVFAVVICSQYLLLFKPIHHLRDNLYMLKSGLDGAITRDEAVCCVA